MFQIPIKKKSLQNLNDLNNVDIDMYVCGKSLMFWVGGSIFYVGCQVFIVKCGADWFNDVGKD